MIILPFIYTLDYFEIIPEGWNFINVILTTAKIDGLGNTLKLPWKIITFQG